LVDWVRTISFEGVGQGTGLFTGVLGGAIRRSGKRGISSKHSGKRDEMMRESEEMIPSVV
jgi:hypothetical protein